MAGMGEGHGGAEEQGNGAQGFTQVHKVSLTK
jgi:hypothetical protein